MSCFCGCMSSIELECTAFGGQCIGRSYTGFGAACFGCPECTFPQTGIANGYGASIYPALEATTSTASANFAEERGGIDNRPQCEADDGYPARNNLIGRICDYCVAGILRLPRCMSCTSISMTSSDEEYDSDGSSIIVCDQPTAQPQYRTFVTEQIRGMRGWWLVDIDIDINPTLNISPWPLPPLLYEDTVITVYLIGGDTSHKLVYFAAPEYYLGDRLSSYGGYLTYSIWRSAYEHSRAFPAPDVIIGGNDGFIVHNNREQPPAHVFVNLVEEEFTDLDGNPVTHDQFVNLLADVRSIYIRATYDDKPIETRLMAVTLDCGIETYDESQEDSLRRAYNENVEAYLRRDSSMEQCQCPEMYGRMSFEQCVESCCAPSFCVPCQCSGHSSNCYVNVGVGMEPTDGGISGHCEMCIQEHRGDATVSNVSNNYDLSDNVTGTSFDCNYASNTAGYLGAINETGEECDQCAPNIWRLCCSGKSSSPCDCALTSDSE